MEYVESEGWTKLRVFISNHRKDFPYVCFVMIAIIIHFPFLFHGWLFAANDMQFHLHEIYELQQNIIHKSFNPLIATFAFNNNGNAVMSLYPKWPLYIYAMAQILIKDPMRGIYIANIIKTFLGLAIAFYSVKSIKGNNVSAYLFALLYMVSNMVIAYDYQTMDIGVMWSLIWIPLVFCGFYKWIYSNKWVGLSIGLSGLLLSHILSFLIVVLSLLILSLFNYKTFFDLKRWYSLIKGIILTVLLSSLTWVPLVYFTLITPIRYRTPTLPFGLDGTGYKDMFEFFTLNNSSMYLGLGSLLGIAFSIINFKNMTKFEKDLFGMGILFIVFQSCLVPWEKLNNTFLSIIQFPWRLLIIPLVCFSYLLVVNLLFLIKTLNYKISSRKIALISTVVLIGSALLRDQQFINSQIDSQEVNYRITAKRGVFVNQEGQQFYKVTNEHEYQNLLNYNISWDYYPVETCNGTTLPRIMQHEGFNLNNGKNIKMKYEPKPEGIKLQFMISKDNTDIELPFVAYDYHYQVKVNGKDYAWKISPSGVIRLNHLVRGHYKVTIQYSNGILKAAMMIPFFIGIVILLFIFNKRRLKN
ncbi:hypothetical protein QT353_00155 [Lentilactobacillus buchneri]|nr:hypothetical protein [Lentilactobacillus buchneri]